MITLTTQQARTALDALGWELSERDGELQAEHRRGAAPLSAPAHNPEWALETLLHAALAVYAGLV